MQKHNVWRSNFFFKYEALLSQPNRYILHHHNTILPNTNRIVISTIYCVLFPILLIFLLSCAGIQIQERPTSPVVRVGILQHQGSVQFESSGKFRITDRRNWPLYKGNTNARWQISIRNAHPAKYRYRICIGESKGRGEARGLVQRSGVTLSDVEVVEFGEQLLANRKVVADTRYYQVFLTRHFPTEDAATAYLKASANLQGCKVTKEMSEPAYAYIVVSNEETGEEVVTKDAVRVSGTAIKIKGVDVGSSFHWAHEEDRTFRGIMEFLIDDAGQLTAVNILPLEDYLRGVVPAEMPAGFPLEALKAQTVASRTFFLSQFGHSHKDDPFDVCDNVHCQVYAGMCKEAESTNEAVAATRGLVLSFNDELCHTPYASMCGGHTERPENVWDTHSKPYLKGILDLDNGSELASALDLTQEDKVCTWVTASPKVFCNTLAPELPSAFEYTRKYFRWQVRYTQQELRDIIESKTGRKLGSLIDVLPIRRGVSGRLIEVEIHGTRENFRINGELAIRQALSPKALYSSCFVVETYDSQQGIPKEFVFKGAGWGHGVGMCQTGAGVMALRGSTFDRILSHYYPGTQIKRLY